MSTRRGVVTSTHRWALDIVERQYEWDVGRWVVVATRVLHADPDQRFRSNMKEIVQ